MKIKNYQIVIFAIATLFFILNFSFIKPGEIGVVINLFGDEKGPSPKELSTGMHWIAPWKRIYRFPTWMQNETWEGKNGFEFQTRDGLVIGADVGISFHLRRDSIHLLFDKYRRGISEISEIFVHNYVRDSINRFASRVSIGELYGDNKCSFVDDVQQDLREQLHPIGIDIDRVYLIGTLHMPHQVVQALNSKIEATQRAEQRENELRESEAMAAKEVAFAKGMAEKLMIQAKSEADANHMLSQSLSDRLIALKTLEKWDGKLPTYMGSELPSIFLDGKK